MAQRTDRFSQKELMILDAALALLKEAGDAGLTLRKLAERCDMRLSNVQYYFGSRDAVLKAMATRYFEACAEEVRQLIVETETMALRHRTALLVTTVLRHGEALSDMCRIFRELWAISSRNEEISAHLGSYYDVLRALIADLVVGEGADPGTRAQVAGLLLPFFEGYSVTGPTQAMPTDAVADMLTDLVLSVVAASDAPDEGACTSR